MNPLKTAVLYQALDRISRAIKVSMEEMESHLDEPVIGDYYANLTVVSTELETTIYAIEQVTTAEANVSRYH